MLRERTLLLALAGSHAHGTAGPHADIDLSGVAAPTRVEVLGLYGGVEQVNTPEALAVFLADLHPDERDRVAQTKLDGTVFELRKFLRLVGEANPNSLELLFTADAQLRRVHPLGERLRAHRLLFLTGKCRETFGGYAAGQLARIRLHHRWHAQGPAEGSDRSAREERRRYKVWLETRNPTRAAREARFGYDTKHAAHLVRLLRMGREILTTGELHVWRGDRDADELRAIRDGAWSYDEVLAWAERAKAALDEVDPVVPPALDREAANALCMELVEACLREGW